MFKDNRCYEDEVNVNNNMFNPETINECTPIMEMPCERVCHREICHTVEHIQPINTRIINHHVYHHTFTPCYTCCEENEICNVYDQNPCCH